MFFLKPKYTDYNSTVFIFIYFLRICIITFNWNRYHFLVRGLLSVTVSCNCFSIDNTRFHFFFELKQFSIKIIQSWFPNDGLSCNFLEVESDLKVSTLIFIHAMNIMSYQPGVCWRVEWNQSVVGYNSTLLEVQSAFPVTSQGATLVL